MNCTQDFYIFPNFNETPTTGVLILNAFKNFYTPIHPFLLITTSLFSVISNILILVVLSRKAMRRSGINVTMMCIATCDFGFSGVATFKTLFETDTMRGSWLQAALQISYNHWAFAFHAASLYLAVAMAFCRVMALRKNSTESSFWNSPQCAIRLYLLIIVFSLASTSYIPLTLKITPLVPRFSQSVLYFNRVGNSEYEIEPDHVYFENNCLFIRICQFIYAILSKGFPCLSMSILSFILLRKMEEARKTREIAKNTSKGAVKQMNRSSRLIIGVLVVCLVTEIPQMIGIFFAGAFYIDYTRYVFPAIGEFSYMLALVNSSVAFVIYGTLSSSFRRMFSRIFFPKCLHTNLFQNQRVTQVSGRTDSSP